MQGLAIILMLFGICCMAIHAVSQRKLLSQYSVRTVLVVGFGISCAFFLSALLWWPLIIKGMRWQTPVNADPVMFWLAISWTTGWNIFIQYASAKSRQLADLSLTQPFQALTPGLITVTAMLLHEYPGTLGVIGILTISLSTYIHGREKATSLSEWLQPFRIIIWLPANFYKLDSDKKTKALKERTAVRWAVASAFAGTMGLLGDGIAARHGNIAVGMAFLTGVLTLWYIAMPSIWSAVKNNTSLDQKTVKVASIRKKDFWIFILCGGIFALHHLFIFSAYRLSTISYIGTMKRLSIVFTIILAAIALKERVNLTRRLMIGLLAVGGAVLLGIDSHAQAHLLNSSEQYLAILKHLIGF